MLMMSLAGGPAWPLLLALLGRRMGGPGWLAGCPLRRADACITDRRPTTEPTDR
jgi:hypothetical protein